jgi:hypothetical protein
MTRGAIVFAFNTEKYNYYEMAEYTAKRINKFLNLPVTIITDEDSLPENAEYVWDNVIKVVPNKKNSRVWGTWINKGRWQVYELTPYDETLLVDADYVINSNKLLSIFDFYDDFACHNTIDFLMQPNAEQEKISYYGYNSLWATVLAFKKTDKVKRIFECMKMVQDNYEFYMNLHSFNTGIYRNDYALTIALNIVNGHFTDNRDFIPWNLIHIGSNTQIHKTNDEELDTEFTVVFDNWQRGKVRKEYINIKDMDFHVMNKDLYVEIINNGKE